MMNWARSAKCLGYKISFSKLEQCISKRWIAPYSIVPASSEQFGYIRKRIERPSNDEASMTASCVRIVLARWLSIPKYL